MAGDSYRKIQWQHSRNLVSFTVSIGITGTQGAFEWEWELVNQG